MKSLLSTLTFLACSSLALAQSPSPTALSGDAGKTAKALEDAYVAAFNHQDLKALEALYAEDVEFTANDGAVISGRKAMMEGLAKYFAKNKGAKLDVSIEAARSLAPDVLTERGLSTVVTAQGNGDTTRYAITYAKSGDQWLIAQIQESAQAAPDAASQALGELAWMVGSWKDDSPGITVETKVAWTKNGHFLRRSFTVTRDGEKTIEGTEIIGYDPVAAHVRSWVFDSEGGFGESIWRQEGNKWLASVKATGPDGSQSASQHVITRIDANKYTWESLNRTRNGEVLPNLDRIDIVRVP